MRLMYGVRLMSDSNGGLAKDLGHNETATETNKAAALRDMILEGVRRGDVTGFGVSACARQRPVSWPRSTGMS